MTEKQPLWSIFFRENPFAGFDPEPYPDDVQGWGSDDPIFATLITHVRPRLIIEVGTWKGRSAINMARICRQNSLNTQILCIDTWLGTIESYTWRERDPAIHDSLRFKCGWPQIYYQFLANVLRAGLADMITPLPQTSEIGARLLAHHNLIADMVYIDASHEYFDVGRDLVNYYHLIRPGGVLFGDDFVHWEGVTKAVEEFSRLKRLPLFGRPGKFAFVKNGDPRTIAGLE